ncbi:tail completion protein gp17 [Bacillus pseudomycoides]|uniref:tail completion protein gp17 n=1 Tax=Bacillus pseudomycoides TaxID=64104 RepID=UPI002FFEEC6A
MKNLRPIIVQALENDPALVLLLGGKRVYYHKAIDAQEFPRITFFELNNTGDSFADNQEIVSDISFQIDIWSNNSTSAIHVKVDEIMKSIGFFRSAVADLYESDTQVFHYAMRYRKVEEEN